MFPGRPHDVLDPPNVIDAGVPDFQNRSGTQAAPTSTYSLLDEGSGIGNPSSRIPSRWSSTVSWIKRNASSFVSPTVTQPGRSGTYAPTPCSPCSTITTNLTVCTSGLL